MEIVPGGVGGTPLYGLYRYVRPQRVWFSAVLVINRVSNLADSGHTEIGYSFCTLALKWVYF